MADALTSTGAAPMPPPRDPRLWQGVRRLVLRAPDLAGLRAHRLELLAASYWSEAGRPVPSDLVEASRDEARTALVVPLLLEHVRAACDGPIVLIKGPEVAARYPQPWLRPFVDLDLLVSDAVAAQRALLAAGFQPVGEPRRYVDIHHLRPLQLPGTPLWLEVHARPKWVAGLPSPPLGELFEAAAQATVRVDGVLAPSPAHHALLLAAHSWEHAPLGSLRQLIDIAAMRQGVEAVEIDAVARAWGCARLWRSTARALDALFLSSGGSWPLHVWARDLPRVRERTVLERHMERWLSGFSASAARPRRSHSAAAALREDALPSPGEDWSQKLRRSRVAFRNAFVPLSQHDEETAHLAPPDPFDPTGKDA